MENNKDNKKHDEGTKAEGFPTFEEKRETASGVTASSKEKQSAKPKAMDTASNEQLSEQEAKAKRRKIRQAKRLALIGSMLILVAVVAAMAIWGIMHLRPSDKAIQGQADCEVVRISGKLAGRLVELYVKEGDYVHKGQRLAKIYSSTTDATYSKAKEMKNVAANQNLKVERSRHASRQ